MSTLLVDDVVEAMSKNALLEELAEGHLELDKIGVPRDDIVNVLSIAERISLAANLLRQSAPVEVKPNPYAGWKVPPYYNGEHDQGMGVPEKCKCGNALRLKPLGWECEKCGGNYGR